MADTKSTLLEKEPEGRKAGAHPSGAKDDPAVTAASKKAAEIQEDRMNPSSPGDTGTTPGSNAEIG